MKILLFANTEWYLYNFRRSLALALQSAGHEVLLVSPPGAYGEKLAALGLRWIPAPMQRRSLNPLRELALVNWLRKLVLREDVDLVHGFTMKCAVYGSLAARMAERSSVNAVAGLGYVFTSEQWRARLLRPIVSMVLRFALDAPKARLILQNPDDVALFRDRLGLDPATIRLIPGSGVDCERFTPAGPQRVRGVFRVLLPARLLWDKGVQEFVEAARLLKSEGRSMECLLAGEPDDGNPNAVSATALKEWAAEGSVTWLGHVGDMAGLYRSVDVVVLPSYREGLPKGLIEAAACALPLVTTAVAGCREVVTHEVDGLLVPARDAAALAVAIAKLQDDPELRVRMGRAARQKALSRFEQNSIIAQTVSVYSELLPTAAQAVSHHVAGSPGAGAPVVTLNHNEGNWK